MPGTEFADQIEQWLRGMTVTDAALDRIDVRLREVLVIRMGLDVGRMRTVDETADHFELTVERTCQLLDMAWAALDDASAASPGSDDDVEHAGMVVTSRIVETITRIGDVRDTWQTFDERERCAVEVTLGLPSGPAPEFSAAAAQLGISPAKLVDVLRGCLRKFRGA